MMMMCVSWNAKQLELDAIKHIFDAIIVYSSSLLSIHSSFSNTTRQIKYKKWEFFASSRSNCCYTQKRRYFIECTSFLLHSLTFHECTYISSHRPNEQLFSRKTPKLLQLIIFFFYFFAHQVLCTHTYAHYFFSTKVVSAHRFSS